MQARQNALNKWLKSIFGDTPFTLSPLAGDASFRRYFRLHCGELTRVVMDAPPEKEAITPFLNINHKLAAIGIHTPEIHAVEHTHGFILLEDLGDQLFLHALSRDNADLLYSSAMTTLTRLQKCPIDDPQLPHFDKTHMLKGLSLFRDWFLQAYLGLELSTSEHQLLDETFTWLTMQIAAQPQVFIHRDYHSRNLIVINQHDPYDLGVIDFQDAMSGPFTYDLVSLLKDCYIQWPREQVIHWLTNFYHNLPPENDWSLTEFIRGFDLCGLQRHLRVLGTFCRLNLRDHKTAYLRDLPLTFDYVTDCLKNHGELQLLYQFIQQKVHQPFAEKVPS